MFLFVAVWSVCTLLFLFVQCAALGKTFKSRSEHRFTSPFWAVDTATASYVTGIEPDYPMKFSFTKPFRWRQPSAVHISHTHFFGPGSFSEIWVYPAMNALDGGNKFPIILQSATAWWVRNQQHRLDGPQTYYKSSAFWKQRNKVHRTDGKTRQLKRLGWWVDGKRRSRAVARWAGLRLCVFGLAQTKNVYTSS